MDDLQKIVISTAKDISGKNITVNSFQRKDGNKHKD